MEGDGRAIAGGWKGGWKAIAGDGRAIEIAATEMHNAGGEAHCGMLAPSWSAYENRAASRRINICGQCIALLCSRADGPAFATCCHTVLVTDTAGWVRMGGAAVQQRSPTLYGAKACCGV